MAFPPVLCNLMPVPLASSDFRGLDVRRQRLDRTPFQGSWYSLLANIYDVRRQEIEERDQKRWARRRRLIVMVTAIVMVLLGTATVVATVQRARAQRAAVAEREARERAEGATRLAEDARAVAEQRRAETESARAAESAARRRAEGSEAESLRQRDEATRQREVAIRQSQVALARQLAAHSRLTRRSIPPGWSGACCWRWKLFAGIPPGRRTSRYGTSCR